MEPSKIYYRLRKERSYLLKSYLMDFMLMGLFMLTLHILNWMPSLELSHWQIALTLTLAVINGLVISSLLHNTSHANVRGKLLNRLVGEYCGYWVLYGFSNFTMIHMLHHQHSDDELDPVNPNGMTFFVFLTAPMRYMIKRAKLFLYKTHGHHSDYAHIMKAQSLVFHLNLALRAACWFMLLGQTLFTFFFLPSFLTIVCIFAHINYVCHRDQEDGSVEIVNINHNLYYKVANFFTMGGYYHRNHHTNMKAFNPMNVDSAQSEIGRYIPAKNVQEISIRQYLDIDNVWGERESHSALEQVI